MVNAVSRCPRQTSPCPPKLEKAAQEFEGMLLADLLKFGNEEAQQGGELDLTSSNYEDLRNQAVATALARNGGIGIARMLVEKLHGSAQVKDFSSAADT